MKDIRPHQIVFAGALGYPERSSWELGRARFFEQLRRMAENRLLDIAFLFGYFVRETTPTAFDVVSRASRFARRGLWQAGALVWIAVVLSLLY